MRARTIFLSVASFIVLLSLSSCKNNQVNQASLPLVTYSISRNEDPWHRALVKQLRANLPNDIDVFRFQMKSAEGNAVLQINDLNTYLNEQPKVLMVSPVGPQIEPALERAYKNGVPIVMLDAKVGNRYTTFVGANNFNIGQEVAKYMGQQLNGQGTILIMPGMMQSSMTQDRIAGFNAIMKTAYPAIKVIVGPDSLYVLQNAWVNMNLFLQTKQPFDAVFALNDQMALGVAGALEAAATAEKLVVGIDCVSRTALKAIKDGKIDASFVNPLPGQKALELVVKVLNGEPVQKEYTLPTMRVDAANVEQYAQENAYLVD